VGEIYNRDPHVTSFFAGGRANTGSDGTYDTLLDTPFDYPLFFALRGALTHRAPMSSIGDVLAQDTLYPHPERLVTFIGNHDVGRFLSEPGSSAAALHLAFGLLATLRGTPQLYYGDEIGMTGGDDPDNRRDFPGGFVGDRQNAFEKSSRTAAQEAMYGWVQSVMQLREQTPALKSGEQATLYANKSILAFVRVLDSAATVEAGRMAAANCTSQPQAQRYLIVVNNAVIAQAFARSTDAGPLAGCMHFTAALPNGTVAVWKSNHLQVELPAQEIGIFRVTP